MSDGSTVVTLVPGDSEVLACRATYEALDGDIGWHASYSREASTLNVTTAFDVGLGDDGVREVGLLQVGVEQVRQGKVGVME